ncbi:DUF4157 domain-containing protein [Saccharicrinis sp. FJH54]|uniref:eCIS core domain-containing protein n=1 Tax=Saccharicrinis sp. FJH54 TaxID=3344665 RepID=UPI0035D4A4DB
MKKPVQHKAKQNTDKHHSQPFFKGRNASGFFGIQEKLTVGKPGDIYEQEADRMADAVLTRNSGVETQNALSNGNRTSEHGSLQGMIHKMEEEEVQNSLQEMIQRQEEEEELQMSAEEEREKVQKQEEEELQLQSGADEEEIQMQADNEEGELQTKLIQKKDEEEVQTRRDNVATQTTSGIEHSLNASKGGGSAMPDDVRQQMESGFGTDFSNVRIHMGYNAVQMNQKLGAQAFTNGNDIYFNNGKYNPVSHTGQQLLAHELTHTIQQGASVQPKRIQMQTEETVVQPPAGVTPVTEANGEFSFSEGNYTTTFQTRPSNQFMLPDISLPAFKQRNSGLFLPPFYVPSGRNTNQVENWKQGVSSQANRHVNDMIGNATASGGYSRAEAVENRIYFFKGRQNPDLKVFGTRPQLFELARIPTWDENNNPTTFQVDHIVEHQLGGSDTVGNYELLEASANGSSGSSIAWEMNRRLKHAYDILNSDYYTNDSRTEKPSLPPRPGRANQYVNTFKYNLGFDISFLSNDFTLETQSGMPDRYWSFNQISQGEHLNKLQPLTGDELRQMGTEDDPALFISPTGGSRLPVPAGDNYPIQNWLPRVDLKNRPDFDNLTLNVDAYKASDEAGNSVDASYPDMTWYLNRIPDTYIFYVNKAQTLENAQSGTGGVFQSLRLPGMSPVRIISLDLTEQGFVGVGKVLPTVPLIGDADIDIVIDGNGVRLRKLFSAEEFSFPPPFAISEATLEVSFGTQGLGLTGGINFGINQVGEGNIQASASTGNGFELEGSFNFDSALFDPAEISVEYKENIWTIGGVIGIPEGKVRGIKNATIEATYSENNFRASGEAELDIPGIEQGTLSVEYGDQGFSVGGRFNLSSEIPGIRSGSVEATVTHSDEEEGYHVMVSGTAQPDIPGLDTTLSVNYEDGALTIEGSAAYERGMLRGNVNIGATNRTIDESGEPTGEPDGTMRVYGGGDLTLQLTPWLEASAGVQFEPDGELVVSGRIGLPDVVDVFPRKEFNRNLFSVPTIEIPLFAIPLGPRSIGLVAQIGGGLDFSAGFGPGQLRELYAEVTYNPDREQDTVVHGRGEFAIPADAGLTLRGDMGLGVSVAIASLSGGIELAGTLGLEGEAAAAVDVNWTPTEGISLDAEGRITVNPKFVFDVNAFARASLGIGWLSVSETWRHNLVSFSWGPDIQFGIVFPVHYAENEPFDISFDDIQVIYADLDIIEMAKGLAIDIKDDIF